VTGYEGNTNTNSIARYWKNGYATTITNPSTIAYARSIAVFDGDVYVAGYDRGPNFRAKYWKNGQAVNLTGPVGASATSILVVPR